MITYSQLTEAVDLSELWHVTSFPDNVEKIFISGYLRASPVKSQHFQAQNPITWQKTLWRNIDSFFPQNKKGLLSSISFSRSPTGGSYHTYVFSNVRAWMLFDRNLVKNTKDGKLVPFVDQTTFMDKGRESGETESEERLVFPYLKGKLPLKPALKAVYIQNSGGRFAKSDVNLLKKIINTVPVFYRLEGRLSIDPLLRRKYIRLTDENIVFVLGRNIEP